MIQRIYDNFIRTFEKDDVDLPKEKVIEFINNLWNDYCGAYAEGRADGLETMAKILRNNE